MILDRFRLDGQVAVVTGAGRGIGAGTALALAECGADVLISSRTEGQLKDVAAQIEALGRRAVVVPADLSDLDAVASLATRAAEELGRLDIVVNNVGGTIPNAFLDTTPDYLEEAFRFLWEIRLRHHVDQIAAGEPPDDFVDPKELGGVARQGLKEAFHIIARAQKGLAVEAGVTLR